MNSGIVLGKRYSETQTHLLSKYQHDFIYFDGILLGVVRTNLKTGQQHVSPPGKDYYKRVRV